MIQFQQIEDDLLKFIKYQALGGRPVSPTTDLLESDILDSLLLMDLVIHIESAYEIQLADSEISPQHFRTIDRLAGLVQSKLSTPVEDCCQRCRDDDLRQLCKESDAPSIRSGELGAPDPDMLAN